MAFRCEQPSSSRFNLAKAFVPVNGRFESRKARSLWLSHCDKRFEAITLFIGERLGIPGHVSWYDPCVIAAVGGIVLGRRIAVWGSSVLVETASRSD